MKKLRIQSVAGLCAVAVACLWLAEVVPVAAQAPPSLPCTVTNAPTPTGSGVATKNVRYWFTCVEDPNINAATLERALQLNGQGIDLGFVCLPVTYEADGDSVADASDATIEALGLYWRSQKRTGDDNGKQNLKLKGSTLCRARKQLAVQLTAATANVVLLGANPTNVTYVTSTSVTTNLPLDLLQQARNACAGEVLSDVLLYTDLLRKFNVSGETNAFPSPWEQPSGNKQGMLKKISRDPTTQFSCPGLNIQCETAEAITGLPFSRTVDLRNYPDSFVPPSICSSNGIGSGGRNAVWRLSPPFAAPGRLFVAKTGGSNFATMLSVWQGSCSNLVNIACSVNCGISSQACLTFTTDGISTYYVVAEGTRSGYGKLKFRLDDH